MAGKSNGDGGLEIKVGIGPKFIAWIVGGTILLFGALQYFGANRTSIKLTTPGAASSVSTTQYPAGGSGASINSVVNSPSSPTQSSPYIPSSAPPEDLYYIQVGSFAELSGAEARQRELKEKTNYSSDIYEAFVKGERKFRVRVGGFDPYDALQTSKELQQKGFDTWIVEPGK